MQEEPNVKHFHHGIIGKPPEALVIQIPIAEYAEQGPDGLDMFYGKMKRMEAMGAALIKEAWIRKQQRMGIFKANVAVS